MADRRAGEGHQWNQKDLREHPEAGCEEEHSPPRTCRAVEKGQALDTNEGSRQCCKMELTSASGLNASVPSRTPSHGRAASPEPGLGL